MRHSCIQGKVLYVGKQDKILVQKFLELHEKKKEAEIDYDTAKDTMRAVIYGIDTSMPACSIAIDNIIVAKFGERSRSSTDLKGLQLKYKKAVKWVKEFTRVTLYTCFTVPAKLRVVPLEDRL